MPRILLIGFLSRVHPGTLRRPFPSAAARRLGTSKAYRLQTSGQVQVPNFFFLIIQSNLSRSRTPQHAPSRRCSSAALIYRLGRYRWSNRVTMHFPCIRICMTTRSRSKSATEAEEKFQFDIGLRPALGKLAQGSCFCLACFEIFIRPTIMTY